MCITLHVGMHSVHGSANYQRIQKNTHTQTSARCPHCDSRRVTLLQSNETLLVSQPTQPTGEAYVNYNNNFCRL